MKTLTRIAASATGAGLAAGALAFTPVAAQNIAGGGIEIWGQVAASHAQAGGPYKAFAHRDTDNLAIGLDGKLIALPGTRAGLAVPSDPAKPAGNVAGTTVRSVSVGHVQAAWAVTEDGAVHKWGGARGVIIPDNTWTATQLGGKAVEVSGSVSSAFARLEGGGLALIDSFGVHACTDGAQPLTDIKQFNSNVILQRDGRVVRSGGACAVTTVIPASVTDPVIDVTLTYATTESGRVLDHNTTGAPEVSFGPTGFTGKAVSAVDSGGDVSAILTDRGQVVAWRPSDGGQVSENFRVPTKLNDRTSMSLQADSGSFAVLYADVANHVKPATSGAARVGSELTATEGDWLGDPASLAYQWLAVDGGTETEIAGAIQSKFTPTAGQLGKALRVKVTATRGTQVVSAVSEPTSVVLGDAPALAVTTPASASGTAQVGQSLTGVPAVFNDSAAAVTNQWLAAGEAITGANGTTLALTAAELGKSITFKSTVTRGAETLSSTSTPIGPVVAAPVPAVASTTTVSAPAATYGTAGTATVSVANAAGRPVAGTVTLTGAGAPQTVAVVGGKATFALDKALAAGSYTLSAAYSGSAAVNASAGTAGFAVNKAKSKAPVFKKNKAPTSKKKGKATVTVAAPSGLAAVTGKATITLKSGKITKKINVSLSAGKKSVSLPKLKKGKWKIQVSYNGDKNYVAQKSKSYNLKIKK